MKVSYDFETKAIEDYPNYPPRPVGLSIYVEGENPKYYAFGHPEGNNSTEEEAQLALTEFWNNPEVELIAFNNPFDNLVAHKHWGLPLNSVAKVHDVMVMCFLLDPHAKELGLKPQAEKHLGMPPEERDAVKDWLVQHGICRDSKKAWGAFISEAPGDLVGRYADGDTLRTLGLFNKLYPMLEAQGMLPAYEREMALQPIMLQNSVEGIRVNVQKLRHDIEIYDEAIARIDQRIFSLLGSAPFNIDSGEQLADAIDRKIPGIDWPKTPTGKRSTSKANMEIVLGTLQGELLACLQYRASVGTCVGTFMRPWLVQASTGDGRIRCQWHTTRSDDGGARTGRLSSSPNFMNIPSMSSAKFKEAIELWREHLEEQDYPALPNVREYILADDDDSVLLSLDYSGQELKVLAHYEDGDLLEAYRKDPRQDLHQWACDTIKHLTRIEITRKQAKTCIAAGELVLTDKGLLPIERITGLHRVWDGVQYVRHTGLLYKGRQKVITYAGLTATPDHEVWTNDFGKVQFGFAAANRAMLTCTGAGGSAIRCLEDSKSNSLAQSWISRWPDTNVLGRRMRNMLEGTMGFVGQHLGQILNPMSQLFDHKAQAYACIGPKVPGYTPTLRNTYLPRVPVVRGARNPVQVQVDRRVPAVYSDELTGGELQHLANRQDRQQWSLRARKLATSYKSPEPNEQANEYLGGLQRPEGSAITYVGPIEDRLPRHAARARACYKKAVRRSDVGGLSKDKITARWAEVYDITNAGPRNRFTVSGTLVSNCAFAVLYGSGLKTLSEQMGSSLEEAQTIKSAYFEAIPGIATLSNQLKQRAARGEPIRTWGGRVYYVEPARYDPMERRWRTYDYKLLNVLIQGSSADITKESIIAYHKAKQHGRFVLTVHDQNVISVKKALLRGEAMILKLCMESVPLDAKLVTDAAVGINLHDLEDYEIE